MTATTDQKQITISNVWSKRIDVRPQRRYGLEYHVTLSLGDKKVCHQCLPPGVRFNLYDIAEGLPYMSSRHRAYGGAGWDKCTKHNEDGTPQTMQHSSATHIAFWLPSERPSETYSESQAMRAIALKCPENEGKNYSDRLTLEEILRQRAVKLLDELEANVKKADIARQADHLITWTRNTVDKRARKNIDFEARLEALKEELRKEQDRVLEEFINVKLDVIAESVSEDPYHPRAIELTKEKAGERLPAPISAFRIAASDWRTVDIEEV